MQDSITSHAETSNQPLKGLRLVVTDLDLQQREHRGIAMYSKALLKALKASGAETWLLTDLDPRISDPGMKTLPRRTRQLIHAARVMEGLVSGPGGLRSRYWDAKLQKWRKLTRLRRLWLGVTDVIDQALPRRYQLSRLRRVDLHDQEDSPYFRQERLSYFEDLDGILCARYLYLNATRRALGRDPKPLRISLGDDFDGLITTCPLNLGTADNVGCLQTVHDLIPLEYVPHLDHVTLFGQRLASTVPARKLYVSAATRRKFEQAYASPNDAGGAVVVQPPSLEMPTDSKQRLLEKGMIRLSRSSNNQLVELEPFRYLLFNSSVESRKNLLFAIKAFRLSGLAEQGIRLCVTGQLKTDTYSREVAKQADSSVLLTGYIDETTKADLFLHALAVLSPSLVEGFGIPVLDGACVGAPVIASPSSSHREIQELHDFRELVWICDTTNPYDWGLAIRDLGIAELARIEDPAVERQRRLNRYEALSGEIFEAFKATVCEQVLEGIHPGSHPAPVKTAQSATPLPFRARTANNAAHG